MNHKKYKIKKLFTSGYLKGLSIIEYTDINFKLNFECKDPSAGSPYKIIGIDYYV